MHLCANVLINQCNTISATRVAIGNPTKKGQMARVPILDVYQENYTGSVSIDLDVVLKRRSIPGVAEPWDNADLFEDVSLLALDDLLAGSKVAFVKIDVEGTEFDVLKGCHNILSNSKPYLFFECWDLPGFEDTQAKLLEYVQGMNYELLRISTDFLAFCPDLIDREDLYCCLRGSGLTVHLG